MPLLCVIRKKFLDENSILAVSVYLNDEHGEKEYS